MLNISERGFLILKKIVTKEQIHYSYEKLATHFNISEKTLRSDIRSLNQKLCKLDGEIIEVDHYLTLKSKKPLIEWINLLAGHQKIAEIDFIKLNILLQKQPITLSQLATNLYLSKSKLEKLLPTITFTDLEIRKTRNKGISVHGSRTIKYHHFINIIYNYVDDLNYQTTGLDLFLQVFDCKLSAKQYQVLLTRHNQYLSSQLANSDHDLKSHFLLLLLNAFTAGSESDYRSYVDTFINLKNTDYTRQINLIVSKVLFDNYIIYASSSTTYQFLINHLNTILNQSLGINPPLEVIIPIKTRFPFAHTVAEIIFTTLQSSLKIALSSTQIDYITIYVQTLINQKISEQKLQLLIVTQHGTSVTQYLYDKFSEQFSEQVMISTWTLGQFQKREHSPGTIIISTVENLDSPYVLYINPLPTDQDIGELSQQIVSKFIQLKIDNLLQSEFLFQLKTTTLITSLADISKTLLNNKLVTDNFLSSLQDRLKYPLAVVNNGIILHGNPVEVLENQLLVFRLNTPILVHKESVNLLFVLLLTEQYLQNNGEIIKELYNILQDEQVISSLLHANSLSPLKYILKNNTIIKKKIN